MKTKYKIILIGVLLMTVFCIGKIACGEEKMTGWDTNSKMKGPVYRDAAGNVYAEYYMQSSRFTPGIYFQAVQQELAGVNEITFQSSDSGICSIGENEDVLSLNRYSIFVKKIIHFVFHKSGIVTITAKVGDKEYPVNVIVHPAQDANISGVERISYNGIRIHWDKIERASGYVVMRKNNMDAAAAWENIAVVDDPNILYADTEAQVGAMYRYAVFPKMKLGELEYSSAPAAGQKEPDAYGKEYTIVNGGGQIQNLVNLSGTDVSMEWSIDPFVSSYALYSRKSGEIAWNQVHVIEDTQSNRYVMSCDAGNKYDIKVDYVYRDNVVTSDIRSIYICRDTSKEKHKIKIIQNDGRGQYDYENWGHPDEVYYYQKGQEFHIVSRTHLKLIDYCLNETGKIVSQQKIDLGKFYYWGGFHYGIDGNYYVAVGYKNPKHSKKKTVIKVMKYSTQWKKLAECRIAGGEKNVFVGIAVPFDAGNCKMVSFENSLYLFTSREMFDGHQANIAFLIDRETMSYQTANYDYTSHSFNQFVSYDNGVLYLSNHGDAFPRGVKLTTFPIKDGSEEKEQDGIVPFEIKGKEGDNYTGLTEGGMETTRSHVLMAGTSLPQGYTVGGVTGNKGAKTENVYLISCDKETYESRITWLTNYHPKKSKVAVGEVRLVKMSDDYVILMYSTREKKKSILHYVVLNENGDEVYRTQYKGMVFHADTQPILYNGSVVWTEVVGKKKMLYSIPAGTGMKY